MLRRLRDSGGIVHLEVNDAKIDPEKVVAVVTDDVAYYLDKLCVRDTSLLDGKFVNDLVTCIACLTR